jgi:hypothetical protein
MFWGLKRLLFKEKVSISGNSGFSVNLNTLLSGAKVHCVWSKFSTHHTALDDTVVL